MANNNTSNNENIYVKVDQNNLISIDPNSVVLPDGSIGERKVQPENLVMYVNLEADIVPRTTLSSDNSKNTLTSIAKGTLNFLRNQDGTDFDTKWTDSYFNSNENQYKTGEFFQEDKTGQSFGIDSINVIVKGTSFIPQVVINFIDVRGKTLFNSAENSPYNAFFHLPWPIFYLTIKGFYGKAIKYRLHLVKFNTKFNENTGNFEVTTNFVGSTYAYLNDIPLKGALNAPYMYAIEQPLTKKWNPQTQQYTETVSKSARGYALLQSIYAEYKQKGLIPSNFPVKTLRELGVVAQSLDKILEREIFSEVANMKIFAGFKGLDDALKSLRAKLVSWKSDNLEPKPSSSDLPTKLGNVNWFAISGDIKAKTSTTSILGPDLNNTLENIFKTSNLEIVSNKQLIDGLKNDTDKTFSSVNIKTIDSISKYYDNTKDRVLVAYDTLLGDVDNIIKTFDEQKQKFQQFIEQKINTVVKDPTKGIGFDPTIRNIFAVLLANAEVYIRLMKDVHQQAFDVGNRRAAIIKNYSQESKDLPIYPWPEIRKKTSGGKENVIAYPGEKDLLKQLHSDDKNLWPEIDFMENYIGISTSKYDPLGEKEGGVNNINFIFESNQNKDSLKLISTNSIVDGTIPYVDISPSSFLYEIWERAYYYTLTDSFNSKTLEELANLEFKNITHSVDENNDLKKILKNNISSEVKLRDYLQLISQFDRYPYYQDHLPTVPYISSTLTTPYKIEQYKTTTGTTTDNSLYSNLNDNLLNYVPETYRKNIYPFNSPIYLNYLGINSFTDDEFKFNGVLTINTNEGFICSLTNNINSWVKSGYTQNLFSQGITVGNTTTNILNTPYFHKQLFTDFNQLTSYGKYVGSSYLLLNSLPFYDLDNRVNFITKNGTLVSSLFREVGSTHFIPYHLMLKWGSIYHRYKQFLLNGTDILSGFLTTGNTTTSVDSGLFFNNNDTRLPEGIFHINNEYISSSDNRNVGIHPFYDAIFHQVVNGYDHYDVMSGSTSFETNIQLGAIHENKVSNGLDGLNYWTGFVDNSKFEPTDTRYTLLPSHGYNQQKSPVATYSNSQDFYFRTIWSDDLINNVYSGYTFPSYSEYNKTTNDEYSLNSNNKKVLDLIATFSPDILSEFEDMFIQFSTEMAKEKSPYVRFPGVSYYHFQDLLKDIVSISKTSSDSTTDSVLITNLKNSQLSKLQSITTKMLSDSNLIKLTISNPKEFDAHVINGFCHLDNTNSFTYGGYDSFQYSSNKYLIDLYIGEDVDLSYKSFFIDNNVELNETNVLQFRPLILIYAGYLQAGNPNNKTSFQQYIINNILVKNPNTVTGVGGSSYRLSLFLNRLTAQFKTLSITNDIQINQTMTDGYNDKNLKIELWNYFKSFNDKWISGNSIGQRTLMEEFLFLDKANRDIGNTVYLNLTKLIPLFSDANIEQNIYGAISMLLQGTGFDMRALPAYVNFYGSNGNNSTKITPSKSVAKNIFGTFMEVDYQDSSPKIVIQFVGQNSMHLDIQSKKYKYKNDSFNVSDTNNNPLVVTLPEVFTNGILSNSNKVVAFEISFGDQNQSIFKGLQLDQSSIKNTTESFNVLENIARSESGAGTYNVDISLFEYYRQASYSCEVTCMGNVMIQPTMFFYLKNIPMFKGSYWITEVSHSIKNNNITTTFKGSRIPFPSLPDPNDSFLSSYKTLFDKLTAAATAKVPLITATNNTTVVVQGAYVTDPGVKIEGEPSYTILTNDAGIDQFGVPYNGFNDNGIYIQKITIDGDKTSPKETWYRTKVSIMGVTDTYDSDTQFTLINQLKSTTSVNPKPFTWGELEPYNKKYPFYSCNFQLSKNVTADKIIKGITTFKNPLKNGSRFHVNPSYKLDKNVSNPRIVNGPIDVGPNKVGYGVSISQYLAGELGLIDGSVVYFQIV